MPKTNVLVVCPAGHYVLRNLNDIRGEADIFIGSDPTSVAKDAPDAEVIVFSGMPGEKSPSFSEVWQQAKSVRWVQSLSAGVEKLLIPGFLDSSVPLTNARGVFKRPLADFAIFGILYHLKRGRRLIESQRAHRWDDFRVGWIPDKVVGVVGYGEIGRECALLAHALGMKVHALRRRPHYSQEDPIVETVYAPDALHDMLREIDVLIAAAPLTPETHHMLGDAEFGVMKSSAFVINVGRGPVIDQDALIRALQGGKIAGAALDVFETEPLPADNPLWDMENVLISPHCTDRTEDPDWLDLSMQLFVENFRRYRKGEDLLNIVDKKAGY